jgi:hypothetical protein
MLPEKYFWWAMVFVAILIVFGFVTGARAQDTLLSDVGTLTTIKAEPCYDYGVFVVNSTQRGCDVVYKRVDIITGAQLFIAPWPLTEDGLCACPEREKE